MTSEQVARLRELLTRAGEECGYQVEESGALVELLNALSALLDQIEAMREALERYGKHDGLCGIVGGYDLCTCGFDAALKGASNDAS